MEYDIIRVSITLGFSGLEPLRFSELAKKAKESGYQFPAEKEVTYALDERGGYKIEKLHKKDVEVVYNGNKGHLTIASNNVDIIFKTLDEFNKLIIETMNISPPVEWYEFNIHVRVYTPKHSMDVDPAEESKLVKLLNVTTGLSMKPYTKAICAHDKEVPQKPLNTIPNWLHLSVGPYVKNPQDHYMNLIYRREDFDAVKVLSEKLNEVIKFAIE